MRCYKCMEEISNSQICPYCGYDISAEAENKQYLAPGTKLGEIYTVGAVIGAGGFGVTYIGWDESLDRKVAIKEYFPSSLSTRIPGQTAISALSGEKQQIFNHGKERFIEEARLLMRFAGEEGIVSVYDVLEANGTVYMVMEHVEGITLKKKIEQSGTIPEQQLLEFIIPILLSLKYVHNAGFTHRDISPDNIMCRPDGSVKLLDFGAARYSVMDESKSLSVIVKQGFTPIEQYQSHGKQGPWTDLYAIGATMYKALTGITPDESLERMAKETLKKPSQCGAAVSENTENAVMAALNIRAENRPQNVDEFLSILTGEQKGGLIGGKRPKKGIVVAVASALTAALGGGIILWSLLAVPSIPAASQGISVPNAINKTESEAEALFAENQLRMVVTGGKLYDAEMIEQGYIAENLVVEQDPTGGTSVEPESTVGVVLSKGKKKEYVPSVTDKLVENALHDFDKQGFGDNFDIELKEEYSDANMAGTVISQSLPEDAAVDFDGKITLTISLGRKNPLASATAVTVDDYTGEDFNSLKQELLQDDIYLVKSSSIYSSEYPYGAIISQSPKAGSEIKSGGAVYVITSLGQEMTRVPDVRYLTLDDAKAALMESGLSWKIKYVVNPDVSYGLVAGQGIDPGVKTPFGSEIELLVSAEEENNNGEAVGSAAIEITPKNVSLSAGETKQLTCSYTGSGNIIWASSNPYIAEVNSSGVVTAKSFGSATISAAVDGNIATATVTVSDESLITDVGDYVLVIGETVSLASSIPSSIINDVIWRSSCPNVASVDKKGFVTAISEGYTSITAAYNGYTAKCGIIVNDDAERIKILKELLLGDLETAKQTLSSNDISFDVVDEYSDTVARGNVKKIKYIGYSDNDSFYIEEGTEVTLIHSLGKSAVQSLAVKTPPAKTTYLLGETPDYTGMVLTATYSDGTTKDIINGYYAQPSVLNTAGTQKITISYENQSTSITVTVNPAEVISLSVTPSTISCAAGETRTLAVTFYPENSTGQTVSVTSSNPSVVKANGLTLSALKSGTADITVKSANGKTAVCKVTVSDSSSLSVKTKPSKTEYYIGDAFKESGLVLSYTDEQGKTSDIKSGYKLSYDMKREGIQNVSVEYKGLKTSFTISIKTPSIKLTKTDIEDGLTLSAVTDPKDIPFEWSSSDTKIFYFENGQMIPVSSGTAYAYATMVYNDIEYSDSCPITIDLQEPEYSFSIFCDFGDGTGDTCSCYIATDIPDFNLKDVKWSTSTGGYDIAGDGSLSVWGWVEENISVSASYTYNGVEYSDNYIIENVFGGYSFWIERDTDGEKFTTGGIYSLKSDFPQLYSDNSYIQWSNARNGVKNGLGNKAAADGAKYIVNNIDMSQEESYVVYATFIFGRARLTVSFPFEYSEEETIEEYNFSVVRSSESTEGRGIYYIDTDFPYLEDCTIEWSIESEHRGGWLSGDYYVVDEHGMEPGESYTVSATLTYKGQPVTSNYTFGVI